MHKKAILMVAILFGATCAANADPNADRTFDKVRQNIFADQERGGKPEDSFDRILWTLQSVPQFKEHSIATIKQHKLMYKTYKLYAMTVEAVDDLDDANWSSDEDRKTYNSVVNDQRPDWEQTSEIIRRYNSGVAEPYKIKVLDWPYTDR